MKGILKNVLLVAGGAVIGSLATRRAVLSSEKNKNNSSRQEEVVFETLEDAEQVLEHLQNVIDTYAHASVADFYDLAGVVHFDFPATKLGWGSSASAKIVQTRDGYVIKLPDPLPITYEEES